MGLFFKSWMQNIHDDKAEELYEFFLESQRDYPGSYPQLAKAKLDKKRQWGIQKQIVSLQSEFAPLVKHKCWNISSAICALYFEMRVPCVIAASFTDAKETSYPAKEWQGEKASSHVIHGKANERD